MSLNDSLLMTLFTVRENLKDIHCGLGLSKGFGGITFLHRSQKNSKNQETLQGVLLYQVLSCFRSFAHVFFSKNVLSIFCGD